jgi:cyanophycin synthetase
LDIHPAEGSLSRLGEEIAPEAARLAMERLFPEGTSSRIRLIGITGSRGASRLAERLVRFFDASGERAGWMDADDGVHFPAWGDLGIPHSPYPIRPSPLRGELGKGDAENPPKPDLQRLLREPDLETAVVAVPPGRILQKGLPYDCAEVGVVLNVGDMPDEFDYLHNIDDFAHALCVVPEKVVDTGLAVLNADDPRVLKMADRAKGRVMLFSADYHNQAMRVHADRNGAAVVLDGDEIVVLRGRERIRLIEEVGTALGLDQPVNGQFDVLDPERREVLLAFLAVVWGLGLLGEKSGGVDVSAFLG